MDDEVLYMQRALELAAQGLGSVSPNPMVGCVIVHKNQVIGEGWHQRYGESHAEVLALNQVKDKRLLPESTLYVTLEPCSHHGKTPPCSDRIIRDRVGRVVICNKDTNPLVGGKGIKKMLAAGIEVENHMLAEEGRQLNKRFFTFHEQQRPFIILKWAQTADGFIARENFESKWISNKLSRKMVHKWRTEEDAVMVGTNTANYDNPRLTARDWKGKNPLRVVIDKNLRLDSKLFLFDRSQSTLCYNLRRNSNEDNLELIKLNADNFLPSLFRDLYEKRIMSVMVEGGSGLMQSLINEGLWDEARVFESKTTFGSGICAPDFRHSQMTGKTKIGEDELKVYRHTNV